MSKLFAALMIATALSAGAATADEARTGTGTGNYVKPEAWGSANYRIPVPKDLVQRQRKSQIRQGQAGTHRPFAGYEQRLQSEQDRARAANAAQPGGVAPGVAQFFFFNGTNAFRAH